MTQRVACPPAPGPIEEFAMEFDPLFGTLAQRRGFRDYLQGLLVPRERNKTLTTLAGAEPLVGAQQPDVQRLQFFVSESTWDATTINARRLELVAADPLTRSHDDGVLVIDDTGDRKDGRKTDHVARQYLGSIGKIENGIVAVISLWADERVYYPVHIRPYTPAERRAARRIRPSGPSRRSRSNSSMRRWRRDFPSEQWLATVPTARIPRSRRPCVQRICPSLSR